MFERESFRQMRQATTPSFFEMITIGVVMFFQNIIHWFFAGCSVGLVLWLARWSAGTSVDLPDYHWTTFFGFGILTVMVLSIVTSALSDIFRK